MSTVATRKVVRIELENREAFLLNSIYAIGLRVLAGEPPRKIDELVTAVKTIIAGEQGTNALYALSAKMKASALSISDADNRAMSVDP